MRVCVYTFIIRCRTSSSPGALAPHIYIYYNFVHRYLSYIQLYSCVIRYIRGTVNICYSTRTYYIWPGFRDSGESEGRQTFVFVFAWKQLERRAFNRWRLHSDPAHVHYVYTAAGRVVHIAHTGCKGRYRCASVTHDTLLQMQ